jgi:hypothetical protein
MKYLLKLATVEGYFEQVDKFTFDNAKFALAENGEGPRYTDDSVVVTDDGKLFINLSECPLRDIAILQRALEAQCPGAVPGGFIREPQVVKFLKGKTLTMLEVKTGTMWQQKRAA